MKQGDIVKYSMPIDADEAGYRFTLLNDAVADGRAHIQAISDDYILPVECVDVSEIVGV